MKPIGIIANPASGTDIRRLVAHGSVFDNIEKVNIVRRILQGLDAMRVSDVLIMPDTFGIGRRARDDLGISAEVMILDMEMAGEPSDTSRAAAIMNDLGAGCIITLGGDGTNRVAAKGCGETPILPVSTGTNNAFPEMIEGTTAGIAAGVIARDGAAGTILRRAPRLDILKNGRPVDLALIDVVTIEAGLIGAKAIWDVEDLKEIFLTRSRPDRTGFSAVGGYLGRNGSEAEQGMHILIGEHGQRVMAPIAPGLIKTIPIRSWEVLEPGACVPIDPKARLIALDGEREIRVKRRDRFEVRYNPAGPWVVDVPAAISLAAGNGLFYL